jgi:argininosuccinate lyase
MEQTSIRRRLGGAPNRDMIDYLFAPRLELSLGNTAQYEWRVHLAHVVMLHRQGIVPQADAQQLLEALLSMDHADRDDLAIDFQEEDLYSYVERRLIAELGTAIGGMLQTGRSRNDLHTTAWRMALREGLLQVGEGLVELRTAIHAIAEMNVDAVMPGYTHTQHAQPITVGYYLAAFQDVLARDTDRLLGLLERVNLCPLGAAALSTSPYPVDRNLTARYLGFSRPVRVGYDGIASRDDAYEASGMLAGMSTSLSRLATDLKMWNTKEFGFLELSDQYAVASSIMPQKKSPIALERVKGLCAHIIGDNVSILSCAKNTSFADVNDGVTEPNAAMMRALGNSKMLLGLVTGVINSVSFKRDEMLAAAARGFGTATDVADLICRRMNVSFRIAHNIVALAVRGAVDAGKDARSLSLEDLDTACRTVTEQPVRLSKEDLREALDPERSVHTHAVDGGPAAGVMEKILDGQGREIASAKSSIQALADNIQLANDSLMEEARTLSQSRA